MKNYYYNGDLQEDIKLIKKKSTFNWKMFVFFSAMSAFAAVVGCGIVALFIGEVTSSIIGSYIGIMIVNTYKNIKESKENIAYEESQLVDLYKQLHDNSSKPISEELAKSRMKDCIIQTIKVNDVRRDSNNKVVSKTNKIIKYFYLLDASDKIQVLKQIKEVINTGADKTENIDLYLLEEQDIKEIPVEKTLKLKEKNKR